MPIYYSIVVVLTLGNLLTFAAVDFCIHIVSGVGALVDVHSYCVSLFRRCLLSHLVLSPAGGRIKRKQELRRLRLRQRLPSHK